jgi:hypothetical protein
MVLDGDVARLDEFLDYTQSMWHHEGRNRDAWILVRCHHMARPRSDAVAEYIRGPVRRRVRAALGTKTTRHVSKAS